MNILYPQQRSLTVRRFPPLENAWLNCPVLLLCYCTYGALSRHGASKVFDKDIAFYYITFPEIVGWDVQRFPAEGTRRWIRCGLTSSSRDGVRLSKMS
jgi:hypothetical protein